MIHDEWSLIEEINSVVGQAPHAKNLVMGMGDDCAVWKEGKTFQLVSTDMAVENIHFDLKYCSPFDVGHKTMVSNISDILAMGGRPLYAVVSLGVPQYLNVSFIKELYMGMKEVAHSFVTQIVGGDSTSSERLIISIAIYGTAHNPIYRKGAVPDENIYITRWQGSSRLGLEVLRSEHCGEGYPGLKASQFPISVARHLRPATPALKLTQRIVEEFSPSAMIDVSDGIVSELYHICEYGELGFSIHEKELPLNEEVEQYCSITGKPPTDYILNSGEEYGLLFTSPVDIEDREVWKIGKITNGGYEICNDRGAKPITNRGYNHFRRNQ